MSGRKVLSVVVVAPGAACEIVDVAAAYEATRPGLGEAFLEEVRSVRYRIEEYPLIGPCVHEEMGVRRVLVRRFPFGVVYRVTQSEIQIIAVLPTRADPLRIRARAGLGMA
jgi:hypothetical protein